MTSYERLRYLRKQILNLTQDEFSQKINMSGGNLGNIENGRIGLTERVLADICRVFHVRKKWILEGAGPTFDEDYNPLDSEIQKLYDCLSDENKAYLYGYIQRLLDEQEKE